MVFTKDVFAELIIFVYLDVLSNIYEYAVCLSWADDTNNLLVVAVEHENAPLMIFIYQEWF